ncbi:amidohydrolase family protein [Pseudozobellia thermophila]|uniref:Amidohydrolase n=1 Tax=Pseudozobellia thermophila TaxID=192903 RepID=A0A1M6JQT6_9FLAO|nr:amidohydrolase family protein [Pseudozobellia thermophila]SHJ49028.1 Amidohydrolase [Pseudozobellia thermophila]
MKNLLPLLLLLCAFACKEKPSNTESPNTAHTAPTETEVQIIDAHAHFKYDRDYLPGFMKSRQMKAVLVDVALADSEDSTITKRNWREYVALAQKHPELFWLCSSLIGTGIDAPDYAEREIARLDKEIAQGAKMVKVWKNFGMVTRDKTGHYVQIDDPRLQPIWDFLKERNIPVMAHIAEPVQAWRPLSKKSPHYGYYSEHPEYHAYNFPEIPGYETIIGARDNWIAKNPGLQVLCAHIGSMSHDIDMVSERLDRYPNMKVELAARFGDLATQDSKKVRAFFEKYQDRIMFGSDYGNRVPQSALAPEEIASEEKELSESYDRLDRYLSTSDTIQIRGQTNVGLALSDDVLKKLYVTNIVNFLNLQE